MVIEVFLNVYQREIILREELPYARGVGGLVTRYIVGIENGREAGDIEG